MTARERRLSIFNRRTRPDKWAGAEAHRMEHLAREVGNAERLGIAWYQWETARDQSVRESHRNLQGVLISWDEPPSPETLIGHPTEDRYHAGAVFHCRCISLGVLLLDDVKWPAMVYHDGIIETMSRREFERSLWVEPSTLR